MVFFPTFLEILLQLRGMCPFLLCFRLLLATLLLQLLQPLNFLGAMAQETEKKRGKKKNGEFPQENWSLEPEVEDLSQSSVCADVHFQFLGCLEFKLKDTRYIQKVNSLPVWWYFKFWSSSPICLLLFTFQSP